MKKLCLWFKGKQRRGWWENRGVPVVGGVGGGNDSVGISLCASDLEGHGEDFRGL